MEHAFVWVGADLFQRAGQDEQQGAELLPVQRAMLASARATLRHRASLKQSGRLEGRSNQIRLDHP